MLAKSMVLRVGLGRVASEFERVDGGKFLVPSEVFAGVPTPLGVLALLRPAERRGSKIDQRLVSFFPKSLLPFGGVVRPSRGHFIFVFL